MAISKSNLVTKIYVRNTEFYPIYYCYLNTIYYSWKETRKGKAIK